MVDTWLFWKQCAINICVLSSCQCAQYCSLGAKLELTYCSTQYIKPSPFFLFFSKCIFIFRNHKRNKKNSYGYIFCIFYVNVICTYKVWWYLYRYEEWNNKSFFSLYLFWVWFNNYLQNHITFKYWIFTAIISNVVTKMS